MKAFLVHFIFNFKAGMRDKSMLLLNYLFPLGFYIMIGFIIPQINPLFKENMIPSMSIFAVLASTILGMPTPLVEGREGGIYRSYKINGVPAVSILTVPALATIIHSTIVAVIILVSAPLIFKAKLPVNLGGFILVFLPMAVACADLGLLIGVIAKNNKVTVLWSQLVFLPTMLIGGLMMPASMLPEAVSRLGRLLPSTYAMNAMEVFALGKEGAFSPSLSLIILLTGGVLSFILSVYLFRWDSNRNSKDRNPLLAILALLPYLLGMLLL
jgi:ABC-2 type transport system permease protein